MSPAHVLSQLGSGRDAELCEGVVKMRLHGVRGQVQLLRDRAVGRALCDEVDDLELGVGEAVPARFGPRLRDDAPFHTQAAQLAADPARIRDGFMLGVRVECGSELLDRRISAPGAREFSTSVLGGASIKKRTLRRLK